MTSLEINRSFLEDVLKNDHKSEDNIVKFEVIPTTEKGGNFVTEITRVRLEVRDETGKYHQKHLIIKGLPSDPARKEYLFKRGVFRKEYEMYSKLIPAMVAFQTGPKPIVPPTARCLYSILKNSDNDCIVFDDLGAEGYQNANKFKGLDLDHCTLVMGELAKWHALTYAMKQKSKTHLRELFPCVVDVMYRVDESQIWKPVLDACYASVVQIVTGATQDEALKQKLKKYEGAFMEALAEHMVNPPEKDISVIIHGDCWVNNFLFKYEQQNGRKKPIGLKFVDFQCSVYAPLTYDLNYFFYSSTTSELRRAHLDDLLRIYHRSFQSALATLGVSFPKFTFEYLKKEFVAAMPYGFMVACFILPVIMNSSLDIAEVTTIGGDEIEGKMSDLLLTSNESSAIQKRLVDITLEVEKAIGI